MPRRWRSRNTPAQELGRLAIAVRDGQQLLDAVLADADHDQQAHLRVLTEPDPDVDSVHKQVGVAGERQQPLAEPVMVGLLLLAQPADRPDRPAASSPSRPSNAGRKSPVESPRK